MRIIRHFVTFLLWSALLAGVTSLTRAQTEASPVIEQRVNDLLGKLSLEQKIDLIGISENRYIRAELQLGLPNLLLSDGPVGAHTNGPSTAYTAGIALAASWDPALALRMGKAIGSDARARGVAFLLGPAVNIYRAPMNGRNFEYFGEDPYLASRTVVGYVEGVQSQGVVATVKHFALNNEEWDRHNVSSDADERTMREIYFPAFEAAVREAHIGSVMNSYNLINGVHATQNDWLNNQVLKKDWGFDGVLMSDSASTYDGVAAANGGLDLELPSAAFMNRATLLPAIQSGQVSLQTIDDKVRRILRIELRFGFADRTQEQTSIPLYNPEGRAVALEEARESIVLLKNERGILPLDPSKVHTIAIIGPTAWPAATGGGGSSFVTPFSAKSILEGLSSLPNFKVLYASGLPPAQELYEQTGFDKPPATGPQPRDRVAVETFANRDFSGKPASVSYIGNIATWRPNVWSPAIPLEKSVRYTATFTPKETGGHIFAVAATASDSYRLLVDGKPVLTQVSRESQGPQSTQVDLRKGVPVTVVLEYLPGADEPRVSLGIRAVDELISPESRQIAAQADAVIVAVGYDSSLESEGFDRSYALPFGQDALIDAVSAVNKNTIVALIAGGEVDTRPWLDHVPAFLHLWYPGQEGGTALAEILSGARSPEGKLPMSFAHSWEQNPVHDHYYAPPAKAGETLHVKYAEGVFLGYRYYETAKKKPLYPFGFGLSYTSFKFSNLQVSPRSGPPDNIQVSFDVTNSGQRGGAEVAQVYIGDPSAKVKRPVKELKGFEKVRLKPGQSQHVALTLDRRALSYWDEQAHDWRIDPGVFNVFVGDSSENTPLTQEFTVIAQ